MINHQEFIDRTNKYRLFNGLSDQAMNDIFESARIKTFRKSDLLFRQGKQALYIYLILDAAINLVFFDEDGEEILLHKIDTAEIMSIIPTLAAKPHPVSAKACNDGAVMLWHRRSFRRLMTTYAPLGANILSFIFDQVYFLRNLYLEQYRTTLENQIAQNLLQAIKEDGREWNPFKVIDFSISRKDIAREAHASLARVNPILNIWELIHYIRADQEKITAVYPFYIKDKVEGTTYW
jgi:CRP-like cAMP-binding protein